MSKGDVLDQELAAVKIDGDVDEVSRESNPNPHPKPNPNPNPNPKLTLT